MKQKFQILISFKNMSWFSFEGDLCGKICAWFVPVCVCVCVCVVCVIQSSGNIFPCLKKKRKYL